MTLVMRSKEAASEIYEITIDPNMSEEEMTTIIARHYRELEAERDVVTPEATIKLARYRDCKDNCYCGPSALPTDVKCANCKEADGLALELAHLRIVSEKQVRELVLAARELLVSLEQVRVSVNSLVLDDTKRLRAILEQFKEVK